ncbi:MAG: polyprenyl synthetase family protein [Bacteroidetes bacterium]|nr:MAG: polyprenyl synthetase family protein [Bacteroidota bacterium]MBL1143629.1 polyprenyl synthetase family protein [Bacteroidota bacterium]NOG56431.1 polyprenyl synthetase family protein [Bacteroidota bacterium]
MNTSWITYAKLLEKELNSIELNSSPKELYDPIKYILNLGGKRIRPALCLMSAELFGGDIKEALYGAISIEVFHNFTLVHDDIMDEAPMRRGQATVHEKWNRDIAILSGDVMFVKAYEFLAKLDQKHLPAALKLFNQTAIQVCEGQQMDMNFETTKAVTLSEYIKMIELKTAVLLACSLKLGALIANASEQDASLIYQFGRNLGIAFQIQDDLLDAYGDPDKFGKRVGGDIISHKKTYLLLTALEKANNQQKLDLNLSLSASFTEEQKVTKTLAIYNELNIPELTKAAMQSYFNEAMESLNKISAEKELKKPLSDIAEMLMSRVK